MMANDSQTINGSNEANGEKSHIMKYNPISHEPLEVAKKGSTMTNDATTENSILIRVQPGVGLMSFSFPCENYLLIRVRADSETHTTTMSDRSETHVSFSVDQKVTVLQETVTYTFEKFISEFEIIDEQYIYEMTIDAFLEYIERQRLTYMPHRGSRWDKVLKWAEFFALQISGYAKAVEGFVPNSSMAAKLIWAASRSLLEVRHRITCFSSAKRGSGGLEGRRSRDSFCKFDPDDY